MIFLDWIKSLVFRLAKQCAEPFVFIYERWLREDPDAPRAPWLAKRRKYILRAMPALILAIGILSLGVVAGASSSGIQRRYRQRLDQIAELSNRAQIERLGERIQSDRSVFGAEDRFELARRLSELDSQRSAARADSLVEELAPQDTPGFARAHRARALALSPCLNRRPIDPQDLRSLGWHLQHSNGIEDPLISRLRSDYYLATGQTDLAASELAKLAEDSPEYWFALAEVLLAKRDVNSARSALGRAAQVFEKLVSRNPADAEARIRYATALGRLGEFDSAIEIMKTGAKLSGDPRFAEGIGDTYLMKFQKQRNLRGPIVQQWHHLQEALEWNPENRLIYDALSQLCADENTQAIREQIGDRIETMLKRSRYVPELLFAKSNLMLSQGDRAAALELLGQIVSKYPEFHPALNNLAWLLTQASEATAEECRQAELYARLAVDLFPSLGAYRDTLGVVLSKQRRWTEAIAQFEISLRNSQNSIPTLEKIADAYQKIGQIELSEQYRSRIDQLRAGMNAAKANQGVGVK